MDRGIPLAIWAEAQCRRLIQDGYAVVFSHKGDRGSASFLLIVDDLAGHYRLWRVERDTKYRLSWVALQMGDLVAYSEGDSLVAKAIARDPDLWVMVVEDRKGENPLSTQALWE